MSKHKKTDGVKGLVAAGIVFGLTGVAVIYHPIPYVSFGGLEYEAEIPVTSIHNANGSVGMGFLFLFMSAFVLYLAYRVRRD